MPVTLPDLDDLRYDALRQHLISRIPVHAPEWTDHNSSDPGIALLELFSWMADQVGYRLNRVGERNYVAFLQLLGITLEPAVPATTTLAFTMVHPESIAGRFAVPAGSTVKSAGSDGTSFETDAELDAVPAQLVAIISTVATDLRTLHPGDDLDASVDADPWIEDQYGLAWDGVTPPLEEMPSSPIAIGETGTTPHTTLWLGLVFNASLPAGFRGTRVVLTVQLDDDEQPDSAASVTCGDDAFTTTADAATYRWYRPARAGETQGTWVTLRTLTDSTDGWTRSGSICFDVPLDIGPIPDDEWADLRTVGPTTMAEICAAATANPDDVPAESAEHPLPGSLKTSVTGLSLTVPVSGWIAVDFPTGVVPAVSIRQVSFNVTTATAATTVRNELVGTGTGRTDQRGQLANGNVLHGTLRIAVEDLTDGLLHDWTETETLDAAGPNETVFTLDREAGYLTFGDGNRGRPPQLGARIVALTYRTGGGPEEQIAAGVITTTDNVPSQVNGVTNIVAARGGRLAETLDEAKLRAPLELRTRSRAVTTEDFEFLAKKTPGVHLGRVEVVPLRRPLGTAPGLDFGNVAAGAVSVVVVPDVAGLYPRPTAGEMAQVCEFLNDYRLLTTEVHIVPPMYVRLYALNVVVVARPGWSADDLRLALATDLEAWLHVLTGGDDGNGYPLGGVLTHSQVLARLFRHEGVDRVESFTCQFDSRAPSEDGETTTDTVGRLERQEHGTLTDCPVADDETDRLVLLDDEVVFVDTASMLVSVVSA